MNKKYNIFNYEIEFGFHPKSKMKYDRWQFGFNFYRLNALNLHKSERMYHLKNGRNKDNFYPVYNLTIDFYKYMIYFYFSVVKI